MFDWSLARAFVAAAEHGSAAAAARALHMTQPTISRQVAELERQLGLTLFERSRDGLRLTAKGLELLEQARAMRSAADGIARRAEGLSEDLQGTVRISASEVIAVEYLPEALAAIAAEHPQLDFEVVASNAAVDLQRREADLAVRMFEPTQPDLVSRRACAFPIAAYASRDYIARHGTPAAGPGLLRHRFVTFDTDQTHRAAARRMGYDLSTVRRAFRSDSILAQVNAVRAGLGVGFVQRRLAARCPELVPLTLGLDFGALPLYVVTHAEVRTSRRLKAAFDGLVAWFGALEEAPAGAA